MKWMKWLGMAFQIIVSEVQLPKTITDSKRLTELELEEPMTPWQAG